MDYVHWLSCKRMKNPIKTAVTIWPGFKWEVHSAFIHVRLPVSFLPCCSNKIKGLKQDLFSIDVSPNLFNVLYIQGVQASIVRNHDLIQIYWNEKNIIRKRTGICYMFAITQLNFKFEAYISYETVVFSIVISIELTASVCLFVTVSHSFLINEDFTWKSWENFSFKLNRDRSHNFHIFNCDRSNVLSVWHIFYVL